VSYGLYLWHWPIFVLLDEERTGLQDPILLVVQLALTVAITLASYRWLEQPIRHGRLRGRPAATLLVGGFAATIAVAVIVPAVVIDQAPSSDDLVASLGVGSAPVPPAGRPEPSSGSDGSVPDAGTTTPADPLAVATQTLGRPPRVLLVGDSVAFTLAAGLVPYQDQLGVQVDSQAVIACGVARGSGKVRLPDGTEAIESLECHDWPRRWPEANDAFDADVALLVVGWPASTERDLDGAWRHPCDPVFDTWYEGEVREAVAVLRALDLPVALSNAAYWRSERAPDYSDPGVDCLNTIYARVAADTDGVELIDLLGYVCPEAPACRDEVDGIELRDDGLHFNGPSGTVVGMWAVRQALAAAQPTLAGT
ncbi:MAG: acyltransferase, partial [Acidimicrobiales bacterium]|nr:acyltransferase [Acidimicrobiales bacterium]